MIDFGKPPCIGILTLHLVSNNPTYGAKAPILRNQVFELGKIADVVRATAGIELKCSVTFSESSLPSFFSDSAVACQSKPR